MHWSIPIISIELMMIIFVGSEMSSTLFMMLVLPIKIIAKTFFFFLKLLILTWEWKRFGLILWNHFVKSGFSQISVTVVFDVFHYVFHSMALIFESKNNEAKWNKEDYRFPEKSVGNLRFVDHCCSLA
jgi:hypothetical protein